MSRVCQITGRTKRTFTPNLRHKRFWLESEKRWVTLKVSTAAIRTMEKNGVEETLRKAVKKGMLAKY